jgi:hypothetical protein
MKEGTGFKNSEEKEGKRGEPAGNNEPSRNLTML